MAEIEFETYLKDRYDDQVDWYNGKAVTNQAIYRRMQWATLVLAAITPVLIELRLESWLAHVPAVIAALVAILTAGLKAFKFEEHWINYRTTCETLRKEKHFYDWGLEGYDIAKDPKEKQALFVERVENLISRENTLWLTAHQTKTKANEQGGEVGG